MLSFLSFSLIKTINIKKRQWMKFFFLFLSALSKRRRSKNKKFYNMIIKRCRCLRKFGKVFMILVKPKKGVCLKELVLSQQQPYNPTELLIFYKSYLIYLTPIFCYYIKYIYFWNLFFFWDLLFLHDGHDIGFFQYNKILIYRILICFFILIYYNVISI